MIGNPTLRHRGILVSLLLLISFISCCQPSPSNSNEQTNVVNENRPDVQISDLPAKFLDAVDTSSKATIRDKLRKQDSLTLDGTTLTVGDIGANRTATLACNRLKLVNGARIVTNGNNLTLIALNFEFNNSGGISSFLNDHARASTGAQGADAGRVEIYATDGVFGSVHISLPGQTGGDGSPGGSGAQGSPGPRGANGVDSAFGCSHGGTDGGQGGVGGTGQQGGAAGNGGNAGDLVLIGVAANDNESHFIFERSAGAGGTGGAGGPGGPGGTGGEGGSGSTFCGGGHGGPQGPHGLQGPQGANGLSGKSPGKLILK